MAESAYLARPAIRDSGTPEVPRHSLLVRVTHWSTALTFFSLLVSGVAILLAHPRLYWGETGSVGTPSLLDLPLPFVLVGQSGWGRYLHFLAAWISVITGLLYAAASVRNRHFRDDLLPAPADLAWRSLRATISRHVRFQRPGPEEALAYNVVQRAAYLVVVFILSPLMIWTGLAMSPALTSVFPGLVTAFGGQQSARTIHFFVAALLVLFVLVHLAMVVRAGFLSRVGAMIGGGRKERA